MTTLGVAILLAYEHRRSRRERRRHTPDDPELTRRLARAMQCGPAPATAEERALVRRLMSGGVA